MHFKCRFGQVVAGISVLTIGLLQPAARAAERTLNDSFGNSYTLHFPAELEFKNKWHGDPDSTSWQFENGDNILIITIQHDPLQYVVEGMKDFLGLSGEVSTSYHDGYHELRMAFQYEGHISTSVAFIRPVQGSCVGCTLTIILEWEMGDRLVETTLDDLRADMRTGVMGTPQPN